MLRKKKSFLLHSDAFNLDCMTDAEAGVLLRTVLHYVTTGKIKEDISDDVLEAFTRVKGNIDRNEQRYQEKARKIIDEKGKEEFSSVSRIKETFRNAGHGAEGAADHSDI